MARAASSSITAGREGKAGIRRLFEEAVLPLKAIFKPDGIRKEGGRVVVEGPAHGDFRAAPCASPIAARNAVDAIDEVEFVEGDLTIARGSMAFADAALGRIGGRRCPRPCARRLGGAGWRLCRR
jgi:hypothetical protein